MPAASQRGQRIGTLAPLARNDVLPAAEEAHEILAGDRLDLLPQTFDGVTMNAREERAVAPLGLRGAGRKGSAHGEAFGGELCQRDFDIRERQRHRFGERAAGDRSQPFEAASHDLDQRLFGGPRTRRELGRRGDRR